MKTAKQKSAAIHSVNGRKKSFSWIPVLFLFVIFPCIVHVSVVRTGLDDQSWYPDVAESTDFFMYARSAALLLFAALLVFLLADRILLQRHNAVDFHTLIRELWPVAAYAVLAVLSAACSIDKSLSLHAASEMTETLWVLLAYLGIFLYFYLSDIESATAVFWMVLGSFVQGIIGIGQLLGVDFWASAVGKMLICLGKDPNGLTYTFKDTREIYLSFYNPNYAAMYLILMIPFAVYGIKCLHQKWQRVFSAIVSVILLICMYGTRCKAGIFTAVLLLIFAALFQAKNTRQRMGVIGAAAGLAVLVFAAGMLAPRENLAREFYKSIFRETKEYQLQEIIPQENDVKVILSGKTFLLNLEEEDGDTWFEVKDETGGSYPLQEEKDGYYILKELGDKSPRLAAYEKSGIKYLVMKWRNIHWRFYKRKEDQNYQYVNVYGKTDEIIRAKSAFGDGYEQAFTERMYLWSRTVPFLPEYLLVGSGPNTFVKVFPQNDYVMRANLAADRTRKLFSQLSKEEQESADVRSDIAEEQMAELTSRPHSLYLQQAVQTGCLSLVCLLILFGRYLFRAVKRGQHSPCLYAVTGYLIMGLVNDSLVVTAPFFWAILGIGYGLCTGKHKRESVQGEHR